ncbi:haloacid dehalogenase type II [Streptomyces sp. Ru73]|uniref:haloacid dehalogenase type II n=1 Tax=Streptomyces sp. Ru73 TaxID=2080748 RepID=UPI0015E2F968|nr:haloacid dehalogenase type II [Streptomyces sp. Ru73]
MPQGSTRSGARAAAAFPGNITTLVFDVLGTVVDETGTVTQELADAFAATGAGREPARATAQLWQQRLAGLVERVRHGEEPWQDNDTLRRRALEEALLAGGAPAVTGETFEHLAQVGHRLRPWPDAPAALARLARHFAVVALTNAGLAQATDLSAAGGLTWHCLLSTDELRTYKPDPAVYSLPMDRLAVAPAHSLFVAAHPWDLDAAHECGYRTALVRRPGADRPDDPARYDLRCPGLTALADRLTDAVANGGAAADGAGGTAP